MPNYYDSQGNVVEGQVITQIQRVLAFSTTTPLAANAVYTSPTIDAINYKIFSVSGATDQAGGYVIQDSNDGILWITSSNNSVVAGTSRRDAQTTQRKYIRIVYTNGATAQTAFDFAAYLSPL